MTDLTENRWVARDDEFAVRIEVKDVAGFLSKKVTIEPGTRALFMEQGQFLGEVPPGQYQLQTMFDRLSFWTKKKTTLILAREGEVALDLNFSGLPSKEMLEVETAIRLTVRIDDVALFFKNILGTKERLSLDELKEMVMPVIRQAIYESIGRLSLSDLKSTEARVNLELCTRQALSSHLVLHGLKFGTVQTLSISHPQYDEQKKRVGEIWLQNDSLDIDKQEAKLEAEQLLASIEKRESIDELEILAQQVASDRKEADVAATIRRIEIRKEWRDAIQAKQFADINTEEELRRFLQERDKQQLIDQSEYDTLINTLKEQEGDREAKRLHLLNRLDIEQDFELHALRIDLDHAQRAKTIQHEHVLAKLLDGESRRKWSEELGREEEQASRLRDEQLKQLSHTQKMARESSAVQQDEELKNILHKQKVDFSQGEMLVTESEREGRITIINWEATQSIETQKMELQRRKNEIEDEHGTRKWKDQQERLAAVQKMNQDFLKAQQELKEREKRLDAEIDAEREERQAKQEKDRLEVIGGMSTEALVATSDTPNAALLVGLKNHEATERTNATAAEAQATTGTTMNAEVKELYERLNQANQEKADAAVKTLQDMLANKQADFQNFSSTLEGVTKNLAPQQTQPIILTGQTSETPKQKDTTNQGEPANEQKVIVCGGCRTENPLGNRFCSQCGKGL